MQSPSGERPMGIQPLLAELLPDAVVAVETREDILDVALFPSEAAIVERAVEKRRREFTTVRACTREAFARLGLPAAPVTTGERGEPCWPTDVVGSITHCAGYRACALAHAHEIVALGIDAEPNAPLPEGLLAHIARPEELSGLAQLRGEAPEVHWDRLLFSAKESVYKAWFPLARRWLGFQDASLTLTAEERTWGAFAARLLVTGPRLGDHSLRGFSGRWLAHDGLVLTAIALAAAPA